jgi:hypothetical protein
MYEFDVCKLQVTKRKYSEREEEEEEEEVGSY